MAIAVAPASTVRYPWQVALSCDLCDGYQDIAWFCNTCQGNLCTSCKDKHLQGDKLMRKHLIVPKVRTTAQSGTDTCISHPSNTCTDYCDDCKSPICSVCSSDTHKSHTTSKMADTINSVEKEVLDYSEVLKTTILPKSQQLRQKVQERSREYNEKIDEIKKDVTERKEMLKSKLDQQFDAVLKTISDKYQEDMSKIQSLEESTIEKEEELKHLMEYSEDLLKTKNSTLVMFNSKKPATDELETPDMLLPGIPRFRAGYVESNTFEDMVGYIEDDDTTDDNVLIAPFSQEAHLDLNHTIDVPANGVVTRGDDEAWVHYKNDMYLYKADGSLVETKKLSFEINCTASDDSGNILLTDYSGQMIRRLTQKGEIEDFVRTTPYCPSGICITDRNEIVICANTRGKPHKLAVYRGDGKKLLKTLQYSEKETKGFMQKVVQNVNGDLCIAHWNLNSVFVLGKDGSEKFTYDGTDSGRSKMSFSPRDISCDHHGNLFIADYLGCRVHILDKRGNFLGFLKFNEDVDCIINHVDIDKQGRLWMTGLTNSQLLIASFRKK